MTSQKIAHSRQSPLHRYLRCECSSLPGVSSRRAGHPPPVVVEARRIRMARAASPDSPLGTPSVVEAAVSSVILGPGDGLVFYTDGLVEKRGEDLGDGLERLRALVVPEPAQALCQRIINGTFGTASPPDDVAIVVIRRSS